MDVFCGRVTWGRRGKLQVIVDSRSQAHTIINLTQSYSGHEEDGTSRESRVLNVVIIKVSTIPSFPPPSHSSTADTHLPFSSPFPLHPCHLDIQKPLNSADATEDTETNVRSTTPSTSIKMNDP